MSELVPERLTIAVLTYRREQDIAEALPLLLAQAEDVSHDPDLGVIAQVLVVDNDPLASAREAVGEFASHRLRYVCEPLPGIANARNRALAEAADARFLVFIDDDERPHEHWLARLLKTRAEAGAAVVAGAVESEFDAPLPPWIAAGDFFRRRRLPTGTAIHVAATNNLLLDLDVVRAAGLDFDVDFGLSGGEDTLFTRTLAARGERMVWCNEALVTDRVPVERLTRHWVLARAFSSGNSVTRVALRLAEGPRQRWQARLRGLGLGLPRTVAGIAQAGLGYALRSPRHQARGLRTAARGAGMVMGSVGHVYQEYRREDGSPRETGHGKRTTAA
ncbi:glycosyltransferase [Jatrophihabitans telluris]|uniref:Glycosyltransferase n=1 Tax=Jatrophihabitans telluris TaxID=2038343 RepID=A0ABY4R0E2_9ACTN|nr:glycosyltransferase family 2 protein [Jatrophihabitans telluris]UQX89358.1 glycosyltransferase [Jatrophihabitans telluris]